MAVVFAALSALVLAGCGGGGGGAASAEASLFLTDDLNAGYDGVWVSVKKVEAIGATSTTTAFEDPAGREVNVRALSKNGQSRFMFLGEHKLPNGTYTGVRITLAKEVVLFPTGSPTGLNREFAELDASGDKVLDVTFSAPVDVSNGENHIVLDFKLSDWWDDGALVQGAKVVEGSKNGLEDPDRHDHDEYKGVVSGLTGEAPNLSFTLNGEHGWRTEVRTDANTAFFNGDGSANPKLADGDRVKVDGVFSPDLGAVLATAVKIKKDEDDEPQHVVGSSFDWNGDTGTFFVKIREVEGFLPGSDSVKVHVDPLTTRFTSRHGQVLTKGEFFAILAQHPGIEVGAEGSYSGGEDAVFEAKSVRVKDEDGHEEAEAFGLVVSANPDAGSWVLSLKEWEGFQGSSGQQLPIGTNADTRFFNADGAAMEKAAFFQALAVGAKVAVKGSFDGDTLIALKARLKDSGAQEAEARGTVVHVDAENGRLEFALAEWSGFEAFSGKNVNAIALEGTAFKNAEGESIGRAHFFELVKVGSTIEVKGLYEASLNKLKCARMKLED